MIELQNFCKNYGSFAAAKNITLKVVPGRIAGLLGANGAGKTTTLKAITGIHYPSSGLVLVNGISVAENPVAVKSIIGYVSETPHFYENFTVLEFLTFVADARLESMPHIQRCEFAEKAAVDCALTDVLAKKISTLSKGYRQRLAFASAVMHDPSVLVLDEPVSGLDPVQIQEMRTLIRTLSKSRTILLSTHLMQEVDALCNDIFILHKGLLCASGTAAEICAQHSCQTLEQAFLNICKEKS